MRWEKLEVAFFYGDENSFHRILFCQVKEKREREKIRAGK